LTDRVTGNFWGLASFDATESNFELSLPRFPGHIHRAGEDPATRCHGNKKSRSFSEEFKRDAVRRAEAGGHSFTHIARELGIHPSLLQTWRRKHAPAQVGKDKSTASSSSPEDEIRRLKRENAALREDRDILKKAYWYTYRRFSF